MARLAGFLGVTEETIRRDLDKLGREGRLVRTHGGAVPVQDASRDLPFEVRRSAHHEDKEAIARRGLAHVCEGDAIALDASSTVHELARLLPDVPMTVVTNALPVTGLLMGCSRMQVLSTGGILDAPTRSWVGSFAERALDRVNINKLFLSSKGVDLTRGLSEIDDAQARVKRHMIDLAEQVLLLVDHSKFGERSAVPLAELNEMDVIITDAGVDAAVLDRLRELGVRVEVAGGANEEPR